MPGSSPEPGLALNELLWPRSPGENWREKRKFWWNPPREGPRMELSEPPPRTVVGKEEQELLKRVFFSWAEFSRFFDKWCQQRLVVFSIKNSTRVARSPWAGVPPLYRLIHVLKYSYVLLVCKDVRSSNQPAKWSSQPSCPAFITLKLSPLRDRLVVSECQLTHSHPACPREFAYHFRPGHLLANACLPVRITNRISKQFVAPDDVRRLLSRCKGPDHGVLDALHVLEGLFRTDPEAKVRLVFVEDQAMVETVFFLTSRTRALLRRFPRILLVDRLPGLQGTLDLLAVLCVDGAGRLWPLLCRLAGASSYTAYTEALAELRAQGPDAFVKYFNHNWAPRHNMWVRFRAFEASEDLDACALVHGHRRRLLSHLSPSHSVAQCLRDLVAIQWADAAGEAASEGADGRGVWLDCELRSGAQVEGVRDLDASDKGGAQPEREQGRGLQMRDWPGVHLENQQVRVLEGSVWRGPQLEKEPSRGPEVRDWRGAHLEHGSSRVLEITDRRGAHFESERAGSWEGNLRRGVQLQDERASALKLRDWKQGRGVAVRNWREIHLEKTLDLLPGHRDQRGVQWADEGRRGSEITEERGGQLGVKRRRGLEELVVVHLADAKVAGMANGGGGGARPVGSKSKAGRGVEWGDTGGRCPGLPNGAPCATSRGAALEGNPERAVTRSGSLAVGEALLERGQGEGPREPKRLCCPSREPEMDWEPLAKFRAACGPELADLVAEELAFARQHGTRGFHWTGTGFALKDGTSDFFLDGALTYCSCSIHAARRLPCRHLFAARLLTGAALFHMDLLRDCWGRAQEP
ncbi:hypothetical protein H920_12414 [Fukomys damarensis]|uniref:SWIM-type domain-containing protein n=1 Tax=Fukomys damarensis TaxID=885580 RepID=A0A091D5E6_FUKDA|nr:hypothetical protein H920_12414 [Fukomys damarensis]